MCFYKNSKLFKHSVADHDIECYKLMWRYTSEDKTTLRPLIFHRELTYSIGDAMRPYVNMDVSELDELGVVDGGVIHSYDEERATIEYVYTSKHLEDLFWDSALKNIKLVKCVIPKGTAYWLNFKGEYISKELVLKEIVTSSKCIWKRRQ